MKKGFNLFLLVLLMFVTIMASFGYLSTRTDDDCHQHPCGVAVNLTFLRPVGYVRIFEGKVLEEEFFKSRVAGYFVDYGSEYWNVFNGSYLFLDSETLLFVTGILWGIVIRVLRKIDWKNVFKKNITVLEEK